MFWLVHKQNKGIKMIDAIVKLDQYKGIHAWEMIQMHWINKEKISFNF